MKIFAIYSNVELVEKPDWFEDFYCKYNNSPKYHVTLKQSCLVEESDLQDIKDKLSTFFRNFHTPNHQIALTFNKLILDTENNQTRTILLNAEYCPKIYELQAGLIAVLKDYKNYLWKECKEWEKNFKPHLTIASDITKKQYEAALEEMGSNIHCRGIIKDVALIILDKMIPAEADRPENQTIFYL